MTDNLERLILTAILLVLAVWGLTALPPRIAAVLGGRLQQATQVKAKPSL